MKKDTKGWNQAEKPAAAEGNRKLADKVIVDQEMFRKTMISDQADSLQEFGKQ